MNQAGLLISVFCGSIKSFFWQSDTIRLIYAHGSSDPEGDDITSSNYHGSTNRGELTKVFLTIGLHVLLNLNHIHGRRKDVFQGGATGGFF